MSEEEPKDLNWLMERISSVGIWHRKMTVELELVNSKRKIVTAELKEAAYQLSKLSAEVANARGDFDPDEMEAEQEGRPLLKECGTHGEPSAEPTGPSTDEPDATSTDDAPESSDWRADVLRFLFASENSDAADAADAAVRNRLDVGDRAILMSDVYHLFADGVRIVDLDADDETKVAFHAALGEWFASKGWHTEVEWPDGFPVEFVTTKFHGLEKVKHRVRSRKAKAKRRESAKGAS